MAKRLARYSRDVPRDDDEVRQGCKLLVEEMKVLVRVLNRPLGFGAVALLRECRGVSLSIAVHQSRHRLHSDNEENRQWCARA